MFAGWTQAVAWAKFEVSACFKVRVLATLQLVLVGFLLYLLIASNPFEYLYPTPVDGRDLNPLLQDIGMIIHPPLLYMGYVGFAVTFAFAVAGLLEGRFDMTWARWSRPWTNVAWAFLTMGIALGSWWAYRELGWGGWWFWDPVENASLMPWLAGTALIHSLAVSEKRGALKSWTLLLALTTFALSLLGTFLVRSGVLTSVHAFATDPERGVFILALLFIVVGASYILYALKTGEVGQGGNFKATGRESLLLSNNVLMSAALVAVMLGTLYPLVVEVIGGRKMSVGQPYFEAMFAPILLPAVLLMALGPDSRWRETRLAQYIKPGAVALAVAALVLLGAALFNGYFSLLWAVGVVCAVFMAVATLAHAAVATRKAGANIPESGLLYRIRRLSLSYWGMVLAHLGVAVFVVGVSWVKTFETETDSKKIKLVGLAYKDDLANTRRWLAQYGNPYDLILIDQQGQYGIELGVYGKEQYKEVASELRCLVCQNQSLADSHASLAVDLKDKIAEQIRAGKTNEEIKSYMQDRYGEFVIYKPAYSMENAVLWLGPFVVLLIAVVLARK
eukprot:gene8526-8341_t